MRHGFAGFGRAGLEQLTGDIDQIVKLDLALMMADGRRHVDEEQMPVQITQVLAVLRGVAPLVEAGFGKAHRDPD